MPFGPFENAIPESADGFIAATVLVESLLRGVLPAALTAALLIVCP